MTDRENLEWLVWWALQYNQNKDDGRPIISISRGRELLGFQYMEEMRDWYNQYYATGLSKYDEKRKAEYEEYIEFNKKILAKKKKEKS